METSKVQFTNGQDRSDIEPDPIESEVLQTPPGTFNLDDLAQDEDDIQIVGDNILNHVEVRKPGQQEWFMAHPSWGLNTRAVITKSGTKEVVHLIHKCLMPPVETLEQDSVPVLVIPCINLKGKIFIWVIRKSRSDDSKMYVSACEHVAESRTHWIRRFWNEGARMHEKRVAKISDKPAWPKGVTLQDIIVAGFGSRIIRDLEAHVLKELRGE